MIQCLRTRKGAITQRHEGPKSQSFCLERETECEWFKRFFLFHVKLAKEQSARRVEVSQKRQTPNTKQQTTNNFYIAATILSSTIAQFTTFQNALK
jgi:hypothetical protein